MQPLTEDSYALNKFFRLDLKPLRNSPRIGEVRESENSNNKRSDSLCNTITNGDRNELRIGCARE